MYNVKSANRVHVPLSAILKAEKRKDMEKYQKFLDLLDEFEVAAQIDWNASPVILERMLVERATLKFKLADLYEEALDEYQEDLFVAKVQELLVVLGLANNDFQWSALELYAAMGDYINYEKSRENSV